MDTPNPATAHAAGRYDRSQPDPVADADAAILEDLRQTAALALAKAVRRYRKSTTPTFAPRTTPTLIGGLGRFPGRQPDERPAAQIAARSGEADPGSRY